MTRWEFFADCRDDIRRVVKDVGGRELE